MGDKIKILCTRCKKPFPVRAAAVRPGLQTQCMHCLQTITFDREATDLGVRRALASAREVRSGFKAGDSSAACTYLDNYRARSTKLA